MGKIAKQIGESIAARRQEKGWTQPQLAEKTGLTRNYISLLENGDREPSLAALKTFAKVLRMKLIISLECLP